MTGLTSEALTWTIPHVSTGRILLSVTAPGFSAAFYRSQLLDGGCGIEDVLAHYLSIGWLTCLDPSAGFSTIGYLASHPEVRACGLNPLIHFLNYGLAEGRVDHQIFRGEPAWQPATGGPVIRAALPGFDERFYRAQLPEEGDGITDALEHYLETGWREGLDPCAGFATGAYLDAYPDVAAAQLNPLAHFLEHGLVEGRRHFRSQRKVAS